MTICPARRLLRLAIPTVAFPLIAWCGMAGAQEPPAEPSAAQPLVLDPDAAAALALRNSPQLRIDAQSIVQAEAQLRQVLAIDNVQVDLSAGLVRRGPSPALPEGFQSFFVKTIHTETLTASKILWTWGQLESQRELGRLGIEAVRTSPAVTRLALAKLAREALLKLASDERLLDVDHETIGSLTEHQRVTEKRYREGLIAFFEVAQAEAQVASAQSRLADRLSTIERDRVSLRRALNVGQLTPLRVSVNNMPQPPEMDLEGCIDTALENRPEMLQAQTAVRLREAATRTAQTSLRPTVSVSAQLQDQTVSFTSKPVTYQIVVALQKPILDGGTQKAAIRGARAEAEAARQQLELVAQVVAAEVADKYVQIENLKARIASAEMGERAAREQLRIARLRFEENAGLGVEVIDAQAAVASAETNRRTAELDINLAVVGLRAAMGMLDVQEAPEP